MLSWLAADTGGGTGLPLADLGQYGLAGILLMVLLAFGRAVIKAEKARADEAQAKYDALQEKVATTYVPSMEKFAAAMQSQREWMTTLLDDRLPPPPRRRS